MAEVIGWTARQVGNDIEFARDRWSERFPVARLSAKIAFYEGMAERYGHRTKSYAAAVIALRSVNVTS